MKNTKKGILRAGSFLLSLLSVLLLLGAFTLPLAAEPQGKLLYAGGVPFGVKFYSEGVVISGFSDIPASASENPAVKAGLRKNDVILSLDGQRTDTPEIFLKIIKDSGGKELSVRFERNETLMETSLTPVFSEKENKFQCGIFIKQGGAGIGTVTYIDPETLAFGGLGHGICDSESGKLLPISHGITLNVSLSGIIKGKAGVPGELRGSFASGKTGILHSNTSRGVFGVFASLPPGVEQKKYPVAGRNEIKDGKAYILCTLDGTTPQRYEIEISGIRRDAPKDDNKCFTVKVTDKALIEKTGGIIQGMSGSPIIQGTRIVGAITHVMISDPTVGYGIFIENMLS